MRVSDLCGLDRVVDVSRRCGVCGGPNGPECPECASCCTGTMTLDGKYTPGPASARGRADDKISALFSDLRDELGCEDCTDSRGCGCERCNQLYGCPDCGHPRDCCDCNDRDDDGE